MRGSSRVSAGTSQVQAECKPGASEVEVGRQPDTGAAPVSNLVGQPRMLVQMAFFERADGVGMAQRQTDIV